jgi:hypothetical protein
MLSVSNALGQEPARKIRFDHTVRNDFFAGFTGDKEAFARAMKRTEEVLAGNPDYPEALVWHGAGTFSQSGEAFRAKDYEKGQALWTKGLAEMDRAVELAPDQIGVRIPRGAPLLTVSRMVPEDRRKELLDRAKADYLHAYQLQQGTFDALPLHSKGELLLGIADAMDRTEGFDKAKPWLERAAGLGDKVYAVSAQKWLDTGTLEPMTRTCKGCHVAAK